MSAPEQLEAQDVALTGSYCWRSWFRSCLRFEALLRERWSVGGGEWLVRGQKCWLAESRLQPPAARVDPSIETCWRTWIHKIQNIIELT